MPWDENDVKNQIPNVNNYNNNNSNNKHYSSLSTEIIIQIIKKQAGWGGEGEISTRRRFHASLDHNLFLLVQKALKVLRFLSSLNILHGYLWACFDAEFWIERIVKLLRVLQPHDPAFFIWPHYLLQILHFFELVCTQLYEQLPHVIHLDLLPFL